ncbi:MAG: hypothetical protein LKJ13_07045 [Clostridia bacterium]|jgi:predicted membrane protein|nr:hypothetical protein [Clostridia bacterium]MCI1999069.1 hypothetical protein [Clostridia bacterium]MCI2013819.1 hypothetical protein [Clostridia bacterium]
MERSKFWTFVFALMPGAGEMYLGLKRRGTEIMFVFMSIFFFSASLSGLFAVFSAVIWFYSFFDTLDLGRLTNEERKKIPDKFVFDFDDDTFESINKSVLKKKKVVGGILIFVGVYSLYTMFLRKFAYTYLSNFACDILRYIPSVVLAVLIIIFGIYLLKNRNYENTEDKHDEIIDDTKDDDKHDEIIDDTKDDDKES